MRGLSRRSRLDVAAGDNMPTNNSILFVSDSKRQIETVSYFGDFRDLLQSGELITSQTVTVITYSGIDPNPSNLLYQGIDVHNQTVIEQRIRLGVVGCIYNIIFTVGTNQSNTYEKTTRLAILPNEAGAFPQHTVFELTSWNYPYNAGDSMQGYINITGGNNLWLQPSFNDPIQGQIVILSGNLSQGSISYICVPDSMQGNVSIASGTLTLVVVSYTYVVESIQGGIAIISGNLSQGSVSYSLSESMQGNVTIQSGALF